MQAKGVEAEEMKNFEKTPEQQKKFEIAYNMEEDYWENEDEDDEEEEQDSGIFGSLLEHQVCEDGNKICEKCQRPVRSILDTQKPNTCTEQIHKDWKNLLELRIKIGERDLRIRGYD
jgi:hypothetical protein